MKAIAALIALLAVAAAVYFLVHSESTRPPQPMQVDEPTKEPGAGTNRSTEIETPLTPPQREGVETPPPPTEQPADASHAGGITRLEGRVVHADDDKGIAGALVACGSHTSVADLAATRNTETDAEGRFHFDDLAATAAIQVASLGVSMTIDPAPSGPTSVVLRIPRDPTIVGEVVDGEEHGVADASIAISLGTDPMSMLRVARSDRNGHFELFDTLERTWVRASAKGFRASDPILVERRPGPAQKLRIALAGDPLRLTGRVADHSGSGVPNAVVQAKPDTEARTVAGADGRFRRSGEGLTARTDHDGRFTIDDLPAGALHIAARASGVGYAETTLADTGLRSSEVTITLLPFAGLEGSVHALDGSVPGDLSIGLRIWPRELGTQWAKVDPQGNFVAEEVCPGRFHAQVWRGGTAVVAADMELRPGERGRWPVTLPDPAGIAGTIIDPRGTGLADYTIVAWRDGKWLQSTQSDAQGHFEFESIAPGPLTLRAGKRPAGSDSNTFLQNAASLEVTAPDRNVQLVVTDDNLASASVAGMALAPDGSALAGATVQLSASGAGAVRIATKSDGSFAASGVSPGEYHIMVRHPDHASLFVGMRTIRVGEALDLGELRMPPSGRLRATVSSSDGVSTAGIQLVAIDSAGRQVDTLRPEGDDFRSGPLPVGPLQLGISGDSIARTMADVTITAGKETRVEIHVRRGLATTFVATLPPGAPTPNWVWVSLFDANRKALGGETMTRSEDGSWRASLWLAPGHYVAACGTDGNTYGGDLEFDAATEGAVIPLALTADRKR